MGQWTPKHTLEPWGSSDDMVFAPSNEEVRRRMDANDFPITNRRICLCDRKPPYGSPELASADAARIAACVSALAGIEHPPAVAAVISAAREWKAADNAYENTTPDEAGGRVDRLIRAEAALRAALAALDGQGGAG